MLNSQASRSHRNERHSRALFLFLLEIAVRQRVPGTDETSRQSGSIHFHNHPASAPGPAPGPAPEPAPRQVSQTEKAVLIEVKGAACPSMGFVEKDQTHSDFCDQIRKRLKLKDGQKFLLHYKTELNGTTHNLVLRRSSTVPTGETSARYVCWLKTKKHVCFPKFSHFMDFLFVC
jgi:hypothetical protein